MNAGYFFSVPGSIVRDGHFQSVVQSIPITNLVLETDAPALHFQSRGEGAAVNEPANLWISLYVVAKLKGLTIEETADQLSRNTQQLFPRAFPATNSC